MRDAFGDRFAQNRWPASRKHRSPRAYKFDISSMLTAALNKLVSEGGAYHVVPGLARVHQVVLEENHHRPASRKSTIGCTFSAVERGQTNRLCNHRVQKR